MDDDVDENARQTFFGGEFAAQLKLARFGFDAANQLDSFSFVRYYVDEDWV